MPSRWYKFRNEKNEARRLLSKLPLEAAIKNAHRRVRTSWRQGLFATPQAVSATPTNPIYQAQCERGTRVTYFCPCRRTRANGFVVRCLQSQQKKNVSCIAIYASNGIIVCPASFVSLGHTETLPPMPTLSMCVYCSALVFDEQECSSCAAPQFFFP